MSNQDRFDRVIAGWLEAEARPAVPVGHLDRVLDATRRRQPRPAWLAGLGSQWVGGPRSGKGAVPVVGMSWSTAVLLLIVALALIGAALVVGARFLEPRPAAAVLGHLAYGDIDGDGDGEGDIFVADWDGQNPVVIAASSQLPTPRDCHGFGGDGTLWSPDGRYLAFRSHWDDACAGSVLVLDAAGRRVASFPSNGWITSWSPDSTRIAAWTDPWPAIGIYGLDGVRQLLLTPAPSAIPPGDYDPVWSPDGTSVVIGRSLVVPLDGSPPRAATEDEVQGQYVTSADGTLVAFSGGRVLSIADADGSRPRTGSKPRVLVDCESCGPGSIDALRWSPTGDRIVFKVTEEGRSEELRGVEVASGTLTLLDQGAGLSGGLSLLEFSPEGDRILYRKMDVNGQESLWTVRLDGFERLELVRGTGWGDWQWLTPAPE
jgi:Tol biopolymer transport system component